MTPVTVIAPRVERMFNRLDALLSTPVPDFERCGDAELNAELAAYRLKWERRSGLSTEARSLVAGMAVAEQPKVNDDIPSRSCDRTTEQHDRAMRLALAGGAEMLRMDLLRASGSSLTAIADAIARGVLVARQNKRGNRGVLVRLPATKQGQLFD